MNHLIHTSYAHESKYANMIEQFNNTKLGTIEMCRWGCLEKAGGCLERGGASRKLKYSRRCLDAFPCAYMCILNVICI